MCGITPGGHPDRELHALLLRPSALRFGRKLPHRPGRQAALSPITHSARTRGSARDKLRLYGRFGTGCGCPPRSSADPPSDEMDFDTFLSPASAEPHLSAMAFQDAVNLNARRPAGCSLCRLRGGKSCPSAQITSPKIMQANYVFSPSYMKKTGALPFRKGDSAGFILCFARGELYQDDGRKHDDAAEKLAPDSCAPGAAARR